MKVPPSELGRLAPRRELDLETVGERAGMPCGLIRRPIALPAMQRVQTSRPLGDGRGSEEERGEGPAQSAPLAAVGGGAGETNPGAAPALSEARS